MRNLKNTIAAAAMFAILVFGTTFANAGIIVAGLTETNDPCVEKTEKVDWGIIVAGVTGIIVAGFTGTGDVDRSGIIVAGFSKDIPVNCGIIVAG